jgi:hypothetical protein
VTVIVVSFFESVVRDHSKDHAVTVVYIDDTLTGEPYTTLLDSTHPARSQRQRGPTACAGRAGYASVLMPRPPTAASRAHRVSVMVTQGKVREWTTTKAGVFSTQR